MPWGVTARSPVGVGRNGVPTYITEGNGSRWTKAMQFNRREDAARFVDLLNRYGFYDFGKPFHVVNLKEG